MSEPVIPPRVKLFMGIITSSHDHLEKAEKKLTRKYGEIDFRTKALSFNHTDYYRAMGPNLYRIFFSFRKLIHREQIVSIKLFSIRIEKRYSHKGKRVVNIDPGYLTLSNVFLATCKDYFHRVYLARGVYLENEYRFVARQFQFWDWTYPDYKNQEYLNFFYNIRRIYYDQIKGKI